MEPSPQFGRRAAQPGQDRSARRYDQASETLAASSTYSATNSEARDDISLGRLVFTALVRFCFDFEGRTRRIPYWSYRICYYVVVTMLYISSKENHSFELFGWICLIMFIPDMAIKVRRLHDVQKSGWWVLLSYVPFASIYVYYLFSQNSKHSPPPFAQYFA